MTANKYRLSDEAVATTDMHFSQRNFDSFDDGLAPATTLVQVEGPRSCSFSGTGCARNTGCYVKHSDECVSSSLPNVNGFGAENRIGNGFVPGLDFLYFCYMVSLLEMNRMCNENMRYSIFCVGW